MSRPRARALLPPALAPGARVALVAPAGPLRDESELERAMQNARALGWEPVVGAHALARRGYLAGTDADRAADLNRAIAARDIDGIWCLRGGYGVMRILEAVDYAALRSRPKPLIGYSDITALHLAVRERCGLVSYHGPTARSRLTPFSRDSLECAVVRREDPCGVAPAACVLHPGRARGPLVGGNLALVTALIGTPFAARLDGAILVLEDVNEAVYRIDRMLRHLRLTDTLARCAGIVFGSFTELADDAEAREAAGDPAGGVEDPQITLASLLAETAAGIGLPCLSGVPVGHVDDQWTLPLGADAILDADARLLSVPATT